MLLRRGLVALVTLLTVTACADEPVAPPAAAPAVSVPAASAAIGAAPSAAASGTAAAVHPAEAEAFVRKLSGTFGIIVRDRVTGAVWQAGDVKATTWTASTIKLAIAADLLERARAGQLTLAAADRTLLDKALINSDNDAATALYNRFDGPGMLARFRARFGMTALATMQGDDPFWRNLRCSTEDLQALMRYVLEQLDPADRSYLTSTLRKVASNQRWGTWAAGAGLTPGNKDGWVEKPVAGTNVWMTHTVGFAGPGERYVVAVMYQQLPGGTLAKGAHAVSDVVATYFGAKVPAPVTLP